jgi:DNA-binding response OmpR family regulator
VCAAKILLIESARASAPSVAPALTKKGYDVLVQRKFDKAISTAEATSPDMVILDAASMQASGTRMCRALRARLDGMPIILLASEGTQPGPGSGATQTLVHPFTPRKLLNQVARILPGDEKYNLVVGPIQLNLAQRKVRCSGREVRLTPKEAKLLELFMLNPGRLFTRKALIREVWHTDYTGDTRTLDVHMSWLRKAIEQNPNRPKILKTIRGIGYRLDLPRDSAGPYSN